MSRLLSIIVICTPLLSVGANEVRFNRDIRPILSDRCFFCHGTDPNTREAGLRLDQRDAALEDSIIVPGHPAKSILVERIRSTDPDELMPPPESHKDLSPDEIALLEEWIRQGAEYEAHWAWLPPQKPEAPNVDVLVEAGLKEAGLEPNPPADLRTLARRIHLDLTGLPPDPERVDQLVQDTEASALARYVDELLASPHFGERMAVGWLDAVRYADTVGYHGDQTRDVSPYRDWVIQAFSDNMPYDQFTVAQLAGDLLPNATRDDRIAATYNRLNQISREGGIQDREYVKKYQAERVRTTSGVWMGATMACAECHDHKYDPFTAKDFYQFAAFFADILEKGAYTGVGSFQEDIAPFKERGIRFGPWGPLLHVMGEAEEVRYRDLRTRADDLEQALAPRPEEAEWNRLFSTWLEEQRRLGSVTEPIEHDWVDDKADPSLLEIKPEHYITGDTTPVHSGTFAREQAGEGELFHQVLFQKKAYPIIRSAEDRLYAWVWIDPEVIPDTLQLQIRPQGAKKWVTGLWLNEPLPKQPTDQETTHVAPLPAAGQWHRLEVKAADLGIKPGTALQEIKLAQYGGRVIWDELGVISAHPLTRLGHLPEAIAKRVLKPADSLSEDDRQHLQTHFASVDPNQAAEREELRSATAEIERLEKSARTTLLTVSAKPRPVEVLPRGDWTRTDGEVVLPATPAFLEPALSSSPDQRLTRLDLANWLVRKDHPLTARAFVNRVWARFFGSGLTRDLADLGSQGGWPHQQAVLDYLARDFVNNDWDIKQLVRQIVLSDTYRRSSHPRQDLLEQDPYNLRLARQLPRRLEAELIRDNALAVSGLLDRTVGGPSVNPYQPVGHYQHLNFPRRTYQPATGSAQYRRGVYTHWQRTFLHPMLKSFDAPGREECTLVRPISNTPLQALNQLNDPTFVEAARALAESAIQQADPLHYMFRQALARAPQAEEQRALETLLDQSRERFTEHSDAAAQLLAVGQRPVPKGSDLTELAAWTQVGRAILNLHETITRL